MGRHFALTYRLPNYNREKTRVNFWQVDYQNLGIAVFAAIALMTLVYLVQVNTFSTKGFEIRTLQKKIDTLKDQQKDLQLQAAQLQSFQRIQGDPAIMNMVPVTSISYIQTTSLTQR